MIFILSFFLLTLFTQNCEPLNFLVFCPLYAHSHHKFLAKIADTLSESGHNVTFLCPIIAKKYEKVKYLKFTSDIVYIQPNTELKTLGDRMDSNDFSKFWTEEPSIFGTVQMLKLFQTMFYQVYLNIGKHLDVLDDLKSRNFDAMIYEVLAFNAVAIQQYLGIKTLLPSFSITHHVPLAQAIGEPTFHLSSKLSLYFKSPQMLLTGTLLGFSDKMTFQERLANLVFDLTYRMFVHPPAMTSYSFPHERIDLKESESRAPFVFLNSNPFLDFPRPTLHKTVQIGGISVDVFKSTDIHGEFDEILSKRNKTVLISFGSMVLSKDMPQNYKETLIRIIKSFPNVTFIWKYETEPEKWGLENLHFSKWVPQTALLADSRLSAFMTHGGLGSVNELSYLGKPAILVPIFADQMRNAKMLERHNGSICLRKQDLENYEKLRWAFSSILQDPRYTSSAELLAKQLKHQPISPQQLLVKYAEFGAEFGELPSLDPSSRHMSFVEFYMIDVWVVLFFGVSFSFFVGLLFWRKCVVGHFLHNRNNKGEKFN